MALYQMDGENFNTFVVETGTADSNGIRAFYASFPYSQGLVSEADRMFSTTGFQINGVDVAAGGRTFRAERVITTGTINTTVPAWCNRMCAIVIGGGGGGGQGGGNNGAANGGNGGFGGFGSVSFNTLPGTGVTPGAPLTITAGAPGFGGAGNGDPGGSSSVITTGFNVTAAGGGGGNRGNNAPSGYTPGSPGGPGLPNSAGVVPSNYPTEFVGYGGRGGGGSAGPSTNSGGGNGQGGRVIVWYKFLNT